MSAGAETHGRQREENDDMKLAVIGSGNVGSAIARAARAPATKSWSPVWKPRA